MVDCTGIAVVETKFRFVTFVGFWSWDMVRVDLHLRNIVRKHHVSSACFFPRHMNLWKTGRQAVSVQSAVAASADFATGPVQGLTAPSSTTTTPPAAAPLLFLFVVPVEIATELESLMNLKP